MVSFIFADLIVLPILNIYRKYYGRRVSLYLLATFYAAMVFAGLVVEILFGALGLIPAERDAKVVEASVTWNYTTFVNIIFIALSTVLVLRFLRTGGPAMLRMMGTGPEREHQHSRHPPQPVTPRPSPEDGGAYACLMHPEVSSDHAGLCPKCGMALERR